MLPVFIKDMKGLCAFMVLSVDMGYHFPGQGDTLYPRKKKANACLIAGNSVEIVQRNTEPETPDKVFSFSFFRLVLGMNPEESPFFRNLRSRKHKYSYEICLAIKGPHGIVI